MATGYTLGDYFERFVEEQVRSGRYRDAGEVLRAGLRLLDDQRMRQEKLKTLQGMIEEGIASGPAEDVDLTELRAEARRRLAGETAAGHGR